MKNTTVKLDLAKSRVRITKSVSSQWNCDDEDQDLGPSPECTWEVGHGGIY